MQKTYIVLMLVTVVMAASLISCSNPNSFIDIPSVDLLTAIDKENIAIVKQHINAGTDINNYPIPEGIPLEGAEPLHLAVVKGNAEIVRLLLENGAKIDIRAKNKDKAPPLSWAVFFLQKGMVSLLIKSGADINFVDGNGATPVDTANYVKKVVPEDKDKLQAIEEILNMLIENGGLSTADL